MNQTSIKSPGFQYTWVLALVLVSCNGNLKFLKDEDDPINITLDPDINRTHDVFDIIQNISWHPVNLEGKAHEIASSIVRSRYDAGFHFFQTTEGLIMVVDSQGNLCHTIDVMDVVPELEEITDFDVHPVSHYIYLYDFFKQRFFILDREGHFIRISNVGYNFKSFALLTNDHLVIYTAKHTNKIDDQVINSDILLLDSNYQIVLNALHFNSDTHHEFRIHPTNPFFKNHNQVFFRDLFLDATYSFNFHSMEQEIRYNYKNGTVDQEFKSQDHLQLLESMTPSHPKLRKVDFLAQTQAITESHILSSYVHHGQRMIYNSLHASNGRQTNFVFENEELETTHRHIFEPIAVSGLTLFSLINKDDLTYLLNEWIQLHDDVQSQKFEELLNCDIEDYHSNSSIILSYQLRV